MNSSTLQTQRPFSNSALLLAVFLEPRRAFEALKDHGRAWLPLCLIIASMAIVLVYYYANVDFPWLQEHLTAIIPDLEAREKAKLFLTRQMLMVSSLAGTATTLPMVYALYAGYFLIVSNIRNLGIGYGRWFAMTVWASLPTVLLLPLGVIQIMLSTGGQIEPGQLNPLSLNSLVFHLPLGAKWAALLDSLGITTLWALSLNVVGLRAWTGMSRAQAIIVAAAPQVVFFGAWALINLMSRAA